MFEPGYFVMDPCSQQMVSLSSPHLCFSVVAPLTSKIPSMTAVTNVGTNRPTANKRKMAPF